MTKLESGSGSSLKSAHSGDTNKAASEGGQRQSNEQGSGASAIASSGEEPTASVFLQTAAYLLDVHALKVCTCGTLINMDIKF